MKTFSKDKAAFECKRHVQNCETPIRALNQPESHAATSELIPQPTLADNGIQSRLSRGEETNQQGGEIDFKAAPVEKLFLCRTV